MEKRVLLTELVDRGSHLRKEITPTAVVTDDGKYTAGTFWDANKTLNEIVHGATEAQDTLKEVEDKLNNEITTARNAEQALSNRMDDILGIDALDIADLKGIVEDLDPETGILSVIDLKADQEDLDLLKEDISVEVSVEDANGHDYVEIGGIKWATMNVGAQSVTDNGLYFAWGETTGYTAELVGVDKNFSASDYELFTETLDVIKYNNIDGKVILELVDDAAAVNMGGSWRMPTTEEWQALGNAVNTEWTNDYNNTGVKGLICTDKTDNSKVLFFPLPGTCLDGGVYYPGDDASYWSSNIRNGYVNYAKNSRFFAVFGQKTWGTDYQLRYNGFSVRGVLDTVQQKVLGTTITDAERTKWNTVDNKANTADLGTAATKDVPTTGNASTTEVVMGNDSRLTDARNAADVSAWAKASTKPTYTYSEITNTPDLSLKANVADISVNVTTIGAGDANGHAYVDLGLPSGTLWATMNIGANSETGYGDYYMYGKTTTYNSSEQSSYHPSSDNPLSLSDDAAHVNWGGDWKTPTSEQISELINNTTYEWTTVDGVNGGKFTAQNGNYVFLPAAGMMYYGATTGVGSAGPYWSSSPFRNNDTIDAEFPYDLTINDLGAYLYSNWYYEGYQIRAVLPQSTITTPTLGTTILDSERTAWNNKADSSVLTDYVQKSQTAGLLKNDGTVDTNTYLTSHQDISGKANISDISVTSGGNPNGHTYVDLGLPSGTVWATMNVGASSITDYGNYYQYGKGSAQYAATSGDSIYSGTEDPLATSVDTAAQEWGGDWHMPTQAQLNELIANTTYQWVTDYQGSGINGATFTANGQTLFVPAAGNYVSGSLGSVDSNGNVWSSSPRGSSYAYDLYFDSGNKFVFDDSRDGGYSVRPVLDSAPTSVLGKTATDAEKAAWNAKSNFSGSYDDLTNKPNVVTSTTTGLKIEVVASMPASPDANTIYIVQ